MKLFRDMCQKKKKKIEQALMGYGVFFFLLCTWAHFHDQIILDRDFCVLRNRVYIKAKVWACQSQDTFFWEHIPSMVHVNALGYLLHSCQE